MSLAPPRSRPCPGCPFRLTTEGREELLHDPGAPIPGVQGRRPLREVLTSWACHEAMMEDPYARASETPMCAGAAIVLGLKSPRGQPQVRLLDGQTLEPSTSSETTR